MTQYWPVITTNRLRIFFRSRKLQKNAMLNSKPIRQRCPKMYFSWNNTFVMHAVRLHWFMPSPILQSECWYYYKRVKCHIGQNTNTFSLCFFFTNRIEIEEGSVLKKFLTSGADMSYEERGRLLESDTSFMNAHESMAGEGQTDASTEAVLHHYAAFVRVNDQLYELNGSNTYPICHGPTTEETFAQASVIEIYISCLSLTMKEIQSNSNYCCYRMQPRFFNRWWLRSRTICASVCSPWCRTIDFIHLPPTARPMKPILYPEWFFFITH